MSGRPRPLRHLFVAASIDASPSHLKEVRSIYASVYRQERIVLD